MKLYDKRHQNLWIKEEIGSDYPKLEGNTLTIYTHFKDYTWFQKADISLAENFVSVILKSHGQLRSFYYVYDYGAWNLRYFKDSSVKYHLDKNQARFVKFTDRHAFTFQFGRSNLGKSSLSALIKGMSEKLPLMLESDDSQVTERKWNQEEDILLKAAATKAEFYLTSESLDMFIDFVEDSGYPEQANGLRGYRAKAMFKRMEETIDFTPLFQKK